MKKLINLMIGDPRKLLTPFNITSGLIVVVGLGLIGLRLFKGLGAVTNLSRTTPWGLWTGFDVLTGVALAAGGYTFAATVHLFGMEDCEPCKTGYPDRVSGLCLCRFGSTFGHWPALAHALHNDIPQRRDLRAFRSRYVRGPLPDRSGA